MSQRQNYPNNQNMSSRPRNRSVNKNVNQAREQLSINQRLGNIENTLNNNLYTSEWNKYLKKVHFIDKLKSNLGSNNNKITLLIPSNEVVNKHKDFLESLDDVLLLNLILSHVILDNILINDKIFKKSLNLNNENIIFDELYCNGNKVSLSNIKSYDNFIHLIEGIILNKEAINLKEKLLEKKKNDEKQQEEEQKQKQSEENKAEPKVEQTLEQEKKDSNGKPNKESLLSFFGTQNTTLRNQFERLDDQNSQLKPVHPKLQKLDMDNFPDGFSLLNNKKSKKTSSYTMGCDVEYNDFEAFKDVREAFNNFKSNSVSDTINSFNKTQASRDVGNI